jgi:hypothetical protein
MTDNEIIQRGRDADSICSDPTYQAAWDAVMRDLFKQWAESPLDDVTGRERLRLELDVLNRLKGKFLSFMNEATVAKQSAQ